MAKISKNPTLVMANFSASGRFVEKSKRNIVVNWYSNRFREVREYFGQGLTLGAPFQLHLSISECIRPRDELSGYGYTTASVELRK